MRGGGGAPGGLARGRGGGGIGMVEAVGGRWLMVAAEEAGVAAGAQGRSEE